MSGRCRRVAKWVTLRRLHAFLTLFWLAMAVPSILVWRNSVPYLVGVSVYALVIGHWSSWGAARAEDAASETS